MKCMQSTPGLRLPPAKFAFSWSVWVWVPLEIYQQVFEPQSSPLSPTSTP